MRVLKFELISKTNSNIIIGEELAATYGINFFETSAKSGTNINETF